MMVWFKTKEMKNTFNSWDLWFAFIAGFLLWIICAKSYNIYENHESLKIENETQKQTIYRLTNTLNRLDTCHYECFKVSEIRKFKNK